MKTLLLAVAVSLVSVSAVAAKTVTIEFAGTSSSHPGLPGVGPFGGTIEYSTENAVQVPFSPQFDTVWSDIDFLVNGAKVSATPTVADNALSQNQLSSGDDAWVSGYGGSFDPSLVAGINVTDVQLEIRTSAFDIFSDPNVLFEDLTDGETFGLSDVYFVELMVQYDTGIASDSSIFQLGDFTQFDISVSDPSAVPLPAGLPLLLVGLGGLAMLRRRQT